MMRGLWMLLQKFIKGDKPQEQPAPAPEQKPVELAPQPAEKDPTPVTEKPAPKKTATKKPATKRAPKTKQG
jgi:hypothetical protein